MGSSTQVITFHDLYTDLQNRAREQTGKTATETQAKRYINTALHDMHIGNHEKFPWCERRGMLLTSPTYTTGTLSLAVPGDKYATGSGTAWNTSTGFNTPRNTSRTNVIAGGKFSINGSNTVFEASAVLSDTSVLFTSDWDEDAVTDAAYTYFEDEYELADDFLRPIDQQKFDEESSIDLIGRTEFRRRYPRNATPGKPHVATIISVTPSATRTGSITNIVGSGVTGRINCLSVSHGLVTGDTITITGTNDYDGTWTVTLNGINFFYIDTQYIANETTGTWVQVRKTPRRIVFYPPPSERKTIVYHYVTKYLAVDSLGGQQENLESDDDEPIIPVRYRHALVLHALARWYRDKRDDVRSQEALAEYNDVMFRIISDNEIGSAHAQIRPRNGVYRRRAKRPWSGGSGRYDLNGRFDRME